MTGNSKPKARPSSGKTQASGYIDVHHHCVLPEYQAALVRSGAADPSRPLRKNASPQEAIEAMGTLGIEAAVVNPLSVAGVHHGNDADARYLCRSVSDALAKFAGTNARQARLLRAVALSRHRRLARAHGLRARHAEGRRPDPVVEPERHLRRRHADGAAAGRDGPARRDRVHPSRAARARRHADRPRSGASIIEYTFETTRVAAFLIYNEFMKKYPNIKWILAHAGGCLPFVSFRLILMEEQDIDQPAFSTRVPEGARHWVDRFYFDTAISGSPAAIVEPDGGRPPRPRHVRQRLALHRPPHHRPAARVPARPGMGSMRVAALPLRTTTRLRSFRASERIEFRWRPARSIGPIREEHHEDERVSARD